MLKTKPQAFEHQQDDERRSKTPLQINNLPNTGFLATEQEKIFGDIPYQTQT